MELTPKAQIVELIRASERVLVLAHTDPDGDAIGSSLALRLILQKLKKKVDVVINGTLPKNCAFLTGFDQIKPTVAASNDLIITIDTRQTGEELKLGHKKMPDTHQVMVVVSPIRGALLPEDVTITRSRPKYDLVVILDCSSADRIGPLYTDVPDLFFETPTAVIDHHATSSYFAKVNWIDMTATSTAEMLVALVEALSGRDEPLLDSDIATALLTGLTTDTGSFQNASTTPKSLTVAAQLVAAGAHQQQIIDQIFRTKPLTTLKLWGKVLSNIREEKNGCFVWAGISEAETASVGAEPQETTGLIDELLKTAEGFDFAMLLSERDGAVKGSLRSVNNNFNVAEIAQLFGGGGHIRAAGFRLDGTLEQKSDEIVEAIKAHLGSTQPSNALVS